MLSKELTEEMHRVLKELSYYFTSGNKVPVERAIIKTKSKHVQDLFAVLEAFEKETKQQDLITNEVVKLVKDIEDAFRI